MAIKVIIDANITEVNDVPKYRLYARCTDRGSLLPDTSIFVLEIVDEDAPEEDTLYRVAQIPDIVDTIVGYDTDRDVAIRNGRTYWRSAQFTNYYDDVEVGANAKQLLKDEVNTLVLNYTTYSDQFEATSEVVLFPSTATGAVDALKDAYDTAYTDYIAAQAAQTAADAAVEDAQEELDDIEAWLERKDDLAEELDLRTQEITYAKQRYNTFLGTPPGSASDAAWIITRIEAFILAYDTVPGHDVDTERDALEDDKDAFSAQRQTSKTVDVDSVITQAVANHSAMEANINAFIPTTATDRDLARTALTSAQTAKVTADADVAAKYTALEATYDAAKAVCPDWTPDNPLPPAPAS